MHTRWHLAFQVSPSKVMMIIIKYLLPPFKKHKVALTQKSQLIVFSIYVNVNTWVFSCDLNCSLVDGHEVVASSKDKAQSC